MKLVQALDALTVKLGSKVPVQSKTRKAMEILSILNFGPLAVVKSGSGALYLVRSLFGKNACTCLDFKFRKGECRHIAAVKGLRQPHTNENYYPMA